jgi:hypothetical protein
VLLINCYLPIKKKKEKKNPGVDASHLLFVDDTLIFCGANEDQLQNLRCPFLCFEAVSGLKINLPKFEIVPISEVEDVDRLVNGSSSSLDCFMIGRWKWWPRSISAYMIVT